MTSMQQPPTRVLSAQHLKVWSTHRREPYALLPNGGLTARRQYFLRFHSERFLPPLLVSALRSTRGLFSRGGAKELHHVHVFVALTAPPPKLLSTGRWW